jgi:chromosome segregation ATPase
LTSAEEQLNARVETWTADLAANLKENETIKNDFSDVFSGDLSGLLENAEAYRNAIEKLKAKLDDIKKKNKELETAFDNLEQIPDLIRAELLRICYRPKMANN